MLRSSFKGVQSHAGSRGGEGQGGGQSHCHVEYECSSGIRVSFGPGEEA